LLLSSGPVFSLYQKKGVVVDKKSAVKLELGHKVPFLVWFLRVVWFVLSNVLRVVVFPLGLVYISVAHATTFVNRKLYDV
jgi:hypothetical protein